MNNEIKPEIYKQIAFGNYARKYTDSLINDIINEKDYIIDKDVIIDVIKNINRFLQKSISFNLSNVQHIIFNSKYNNGDGFADKDRVVYPPFDFVWMEDYANCKDEAVNAKFISLIMKNPFKVNDIEDNTRDFISSALKTTSNMCDSDVFRNKDAKIDTYMFMSGFKDVINNCLVFPFYLFIAATINGKFLRHKDENGKTMFLMLFPSSKFNGITAKEISKSAASDMLAYLNFCDFLNIKNVHVKPSEFIISEKQKRNNKNKSLKYHTICISKPGKQYDANSKNDYSGTMPLHLCRGHTATYTEEKPLFGKYFGTFYIPAHTRGKIENGSIEKNYILK